MFLVLGFCPSHAERCEVGAGWESLSLRDEGPNWSGSVTRRQVDANPNTKEEITIAKGSRNKQK